ncbi:MAG: PPC domain-containing DNA-binding protein [Planctomycetota bacterium]|jgi:predicted DNA-binding protein with PD1-like motif
MQTLTEGEIVVVKLDPGEEIVASLVAVAEAEDIAGGFLTGLGSTSQVDIAFFDPDKKEYVSRAFKEPMEIGSLVGSFSKLEDEHHVHVHITVAGPELLAFTGHLSRGVVGTACEIYIRKLPREIRRTKDPEAGFNPLDLT